MSKKKRKKKRKARKRLQKAARNLVVLAMILTKKGGPMRDRRERRPLEDGQKLEDEFDLD